MNLAEKILSARTKFLETNAKKDAQGYGYKYFDMPDIEPALNKICADLKLLTLVSFPDERAVLLFINAEKPEEHYEISVVPKECVMKGKDPNPIQSTGAMMSYMRRYLYMTGFCISESDLVDQIPQKKEQEDADMHINSKEIDEKIAKQKEIESIEPGYALKMMSKKQVQHFEALDMTYIDKCLNALKARHADNTNNANNANGGNNGTV